MDAVRQRFLEASRRHLAAQPAQANPAARVRARMLRREASQFPQTAAVRAAITLLRRSPV
ncbi:MAG: hypothetical protein R3357_07840 [Burkholderiales bacterium]|nr:hypothetical protein [Burkholderiales bacterium]